jgi:predicted transcriptional regulator
VYRPLVARADAAKSAVSHVVDRFFASSPRALALALLGNEPLGDKEIEEIRKLLNERRKEKR